MDNIIVITQNLKLDSLHLLRDHLVGSEVLVFSTQLVFENEEAIIVKELDKSCTFVNFTSFMSDKDFENCDVEAYSKDQKSVAQYYEQIKFLKNKQVVDILLNKYPSNNCFLVCNDLGLDERPWLDKGFKKFKCEYYYKAPITVKTSITPFKYLLDVCEMCKRFFNGEIYKTYYNGNKYLFYGSLNRIGYRFCVDFKKASKWENIKFIVAFFWVKLFKSFPHNETIRMSTLHESTHWPFPRHKNFNGKIIQDGYLPPNYSSKYLLFHGDDVEFYAWDVEGLRTFQYHKLKSRVIPFRKKIYMPNPVFPKEFKKVLCVASGAGDWTAVKNRSDEDSMIAAFGKVAALFPNIQFIYRCHPVWIHPQHQGVNSINRAADYFKWLNLPNLTISGNIPNANESGDFRLSFKRSSFEDDLKDVDVVFGEHSISMIDSAFKNIVFCSVNVTGRRDLFTGISDMGFPHCESVNEIVSFLNNVSSSDFCNKYKKAVEKYNEMTDKEV